MQRQYFLREGRHFIMKQRFQSGQSLAEYGLVLALVSVVAIGGLSSLGNSISNQLAGVTTALNGSGSAPAGGNAPTVGNTGGNNTIAVGMPTDPSPSQGSQEPPATASAPPPSGPTSTETIGATPPEAPAALGQQQEVATNPPSTTPAPTVTPPVTSPPVTSSPPAATTPTTQYDANGNAMYGCTGSGCYSAGYGGW